MCMYSKQHHYGQITIAARLTWYHFLHILLQFYGKLPQGASRPWFAPAAASQRSTQKTASPTVSEIEMRLLNLVRPDALKSIDCSTFGSEKSIPTADVFLSGFTYPVSVWKLSVFPSRERPTSSQPNKQHHSHFTRPLECLFSEGLEHISE